MLPGARFILSDVLYRSDEPNASKAACAFYVATRLCCLFLYFIYLLFRIKDAAVVSFGASSCHSVITLKKIFLSVDFRVITISCFDSVWQRESHLNCAAIDEPLIKRAVGY